MTSADYKTVTASRPSIPDGRTAADEAADPARTGLNPDASAGGDEHRVLPIGTRLAEFEIIGVIGEGGYGVVYCAFDTQLGRHVALKEYIPAALASHRHSAEVTITSKRDELAFRAGLKSFINEAHLLAQFDHRSLVKVYRFWEANGTAYMVMPYYEGVTLRDALRHLPAPPDEAWLRGLLTPLIEALAVLHRAQCYHRDIAPDNIMLLKGSGLPLLLDFGAARRVIGDMTQALTAFLKPGYAPVEQYDRVSSMKQGPWTDLYALACVVHFAIQGKTPPPAVSRLMSDNYVPLATAAAGRYKDDFLRAIDHALAVHPRDRPQDIYTFAAELGIAIDDAGEAHGAAGVACHTPLDHASVRSHAATSGSSASAVRTSAPPTAATGTAAGAPTIGRDTASAAANRHPALIAAAAAFVVILAAFGGWFVLRTPLLNPGGNTTATQNPSVAMVAVQPAPSTSEPAAGGSALPGVEKTGSIQTPAPPVGHAPASQPGLRDTIAATATGTVPGADKRLGAYNPGDEFDRIVRLADPSFRVSSAPRRNVARINKDDLNFRLTSNRAGYVYVFVADPAGQYLMLFPNALDKRNALGAGQTLSLPRASWPMVASVPLGPYRFLVLVSAAPRDFSDAGLRSDSEFAAISTNAQRDAAMRRTADYSPFVGKPRCAADAANCSDAFGAATFEIDAIM
jgi:hypothetical protein